MECADISGLRVVLITIVRISGTVVEEFEFLSLIPGGLTLLD